MKPRLAVLVEFRDIDADLELPNLGVYAIYV